MTKRASRVPFTGYVQIYTGNGKGKTTAALGLAFRAAGRGMRTFVGQFLKHSPTGELVAARRLSPLITIRRFGRPGFILVREGHDEGDLRRARTGLGACRAAMLSGEYQIVVLDEVNTAVYLGLLSAAEVLAVLDEKPADVELVLTGRYAPRSFIRRADLVTEMRERKHYFARGVRARAGIEK